MLDLSLVHAFIQSNAKGKIEMKALNLSVKRTVADKFYEYVNSLGNQVA